MSIEAKPALHPEIPALWARVFSDTLSQYRAWAFRDKAAPFSRDPARVREEDRPVKEGTIALCGEKLMGLDLGSLRDVKGEVCAKCIEVFKREAERKAEENK